MLKTTMLQLSTLALAELFDQRFQLRRTRKDRQRPCSIIMSKPPQLAPQNSYLLATDTIYVVEGCILYQTFAADIVPR